MYQLVKLRKYKHPDKSELQTKFIPIPHLRYHTLKDLFSTCAEDIRNGLPPEEQYNIFYTVAHHKQGKRDFTSWQYQEVIPFDLDGIDLDRIDEYPPVVAEACGFDLSKTGIVYSGNGIHILVQVPRWDDKGMLKVKRPGYKELLLKIKSKCDEHKLPYADKKTGPGDSTAWDLARILRAPGTANMKFDKEGKKIIKKCVLVQNTLEEQPFEIPSLEKVSDSKFLAKGSFPRPDKDTIVKECAFFKWLQSSPEEVHEPHAYAMLSVSGHFNDDQEFSKNMWDQFESPSINSKDLTEFTDQALRASGPRTCEGINDVWGGCKECPHYRNVTSPILLRDPDYIGSAHCGFTLKGPRGGNVRQYEDLLKQYDKDCRHKSVGPIKKVYTWTGTHYVKTDDREIKNYAFQKFQPMSKADERKEFLNLVHDSNYVGEDFLSGEFSKGLINFKNGVLNVETMELEAHSTDRPFLYCLPFEYQPEAECPKWDEFIDQITLSRKDLSDILNEYLGYMVSGSDYIYQKVLILEGSGKNGKSTFINIARALMGRLNVSNMSIKSLEGDKFASSGLHGKLANFSEEEPPSTFSENNGVFKNLTGDGVINAQYKFGDAFEFENRAKLVISYNEKPYLKDTSQGMLRRLLIVPFDYDLEKHPDKVNPNIKSDLSKELPGIFNRALEGWKRLQDQKGFTKSIHVQNKVEEIHRLSDTVKGFLSDCIEKTANEDDRINFSDMYDAYCQWYEEEVDGKKPLSKKAFSVRLKKYGFELERTRIRGRQVKLYKCCKNIMHDDSKNNAQPKF